MRKNTLYTIIYPLIVALAVVAGLFIGTFINRGGAPAGNIVRRADVQAGADAKITRLLSLIHTQYIDPVNLDSITEVIMPLIVGELDPHSSYIPAQKYAAVNEELEGEFGGIGVKFSMVIDTAVISNVIAGGPSDMAGLENGDRIIMVDTVPIAGQHMNDGAVVGMLRGKMGTTVDLSIQRQGVDSLIPVTVTRGQVPVYSVNSAFEIVPGIAYIKLARFSRSSDAEIIHALEKMRQDGAKKLILDLRGNLGGYLDQAIKIANEFLPEGKLIVYTENKFKQRVEEYSNGRGKFADMQLAILVDQESASSSEILAGALQDNDCGTIIGRRTFGKGLVQEQIQFPDESAVRLTIARYYTPTGRSIQKPYDNKLDYYMDTYERYAHSEFFTADSIKFADSLKFTTPGGKTVYGGGGIMPDIFIPLDTTYMNNFYLAVVDSRYNILYRFSLKYTDDHRAQVNAIQNVAQLNALLDSDPDMFDNFLAYVAKWGIRPTQEELAQSQQVICALLRGYVGRNTDLDDTGFYSQFYPVDDPLRKAIEVLRQ